MGNRARIAGSWRGCAADAGLRPWPRRLDALLCQLDEALRR